MSFALIKINDATLSNYLGQSGKIKMRLQELPEILLKNQISRGSEIFALILL